MLKKAIFLTFILGSGLALGQKQISVHLPANGTYVAFATHGIPTAAPTGVPVSQGGDVSVMLLPTDDRISVWDQTANAVATATLAQASTGWTVTAGAFKSVGWVDVSVQAKGAPVQAGEVRLQDSVSRDPQPLTPSSQGTVKFFNVTPGTIKVTVQASGIPSETHLFTLAANRADPEPRFMVALAVPLTGTTPASSAAPTASPAPTGVAPPASHAQPTNFFGSLITYLIGIAAAVGVGYLLFVYFKKNPGTVSEKLEQLGVQIPKPDSIGAAGGAPVPFDPQPRPAPVQKIILDDAAPTPLVNPVPVQSAVATLAAEPSLVSSSGVAIPVADGETIVGRDPGLGLSLTGESSISRRHASIEKLGGQVTVSDLGSTNGTYVNGVKLTSPTPLRPGDTVQFGSVSFRFQA